MTFYDVWIARPEQPTVSFPEGRAAFFAIREGTKFRRWPGEQADHLRWEAQMMRPEIEALLAEVYGPEGEYEAKHAGPLEHLANKMRALRAFVAGLPEGNAVTVVADAF
jgi:hypothetical protein